MSGIAGGSLFIGKPLIVFYGDRMVPNSGAYDNSNDYYRNDLVVTSVLKDSVGSTVTGSAVTLSLVSSDKGNRQGCYEGTMSGSIVISSAATYYLEITATLSAATVDFRRIEYIAEYEGAS